MKKKVLIAGSIIFLLFAGVVLSQRGGMQPVIQKTPEELLADAAEGTRTIQCAIDSEGVTGTVYLKGMQARLTGTVRSSILYEDMTDILSRDGTGYLWNDQTKTGYTTPVDPENEDNILNIYTVSQLSEEQRKTALENTGIDLSSCQVVRDDEEIFSVPSDVSFSSLEEKTNEEWGGKIREMLDEAVEQGLEEGREYSQ